jgi:hypothetical protein
VGISSYIPQALTQPFPKVNLTITLQASFTLPSFKACPQLLSPSSFSYSLFMAFWSDQPNQICSRLTSTIIHASFLPNFPN